MFKKGDIVTGKKLSSLYYYYTNDAAIMRVLRIWDNDSMIVRLENASSKAKGILRQDILENIGAAFKVEQQHFKIYQEEEGWD